MTESWFFGTLGVALAPARPAAGYGRTSGRPLAKLTLEETGEILPDRRAVRLSEIGGTPQSLWRGADGSLLLRSGDRTVLSAGNAHARLATPLSQPLGLQLVVTFVLPRAVQAVGALVLHACAVAGPRGALVVCAESGVGKSSLLAALATAGWEPLAEDLCTIELADGVPRVWPGPPWVRVRGEEPPFPGAVVRFRAADKVAWDLDGMRPPAPAPTRVVGLVLLDAPGEDCHTEAAAAADVIPALARHAPWFDEQEVRARALFPPVAELAASVPVTRVRLRRHEAWRDDAVEVFSRVAEC